MKLISTLVLLAGVFPLSFTHASECETVNLLENSASPLHQVPIYHQGSTDLCYAATGAQLIESWLREKGEWTDPTAHLNPLWVSLAHKADGNTQPMMLPTLLGNGFLPAALTDFQKQGMCDPKLFQERFAKFREGSQLMEADFIELLEKLWARKTKTPNEPFAESLAALKESGLYGAIQARTAVTRGGFDREVETVYSIVDRRIQLARAAGERLNGKLKLRWLRDEVFAECTARAMTQPRMNEWKGGGLGYESNRTLATKIDAVLKGETPRPLSLGYCSNVLRGSDYPRRIPGLPRLSRALQAAQCSLHYSLVIGQRKNPESAKCEYLVRNSAGRDFWTKKYACLCEKTNGTGYEDCVPTAQEPRTDRVVGCWIPSEPLLETAFDLLSY